MKTTRDYDVIIIGAGPAGLECARELLNSPLKILLIERKEVIGPKPCAGGARESETIIELPENLTKKHHTQQSVLGNSECLIELKNDAFRCFERKELGQYQLSLITPKKGETSNVTILKGTLVKEITNKYVVTTNGSFGYRYLVGADGAASIVRKFLGLPSQCTMGLYYNVKPTSNQLVSLYDPKNLRTGYIWEFPHLEYNNVGIYFEPRFINAVKAKTLLQEYLKKKKYKYSEADFGGALINHDYMGHKFGKIFLIGDAGGFTSRLHGGGISNGMTSGRDVARLILDPEYKTKGIEEVLKIKQQEAHLLDTAESLPVWLMTLLLGLLIRIMKFSWVQKRMKLV